MLFRSFVKFLTDDDARQAAKVWNHKSFQVHDKSYTLHVEVASNQGTINKKQSRQPPQVQPLSSLTPTLLNNDDTTALLAQRKRTCRVMVRNLSFSAKERDIRTTLERTFGPILELQLPWVNASTHRGFCFVTFANPKDALQSTTTKNILIAKRPVAIDYALPKKMHQQQQQQQKEQQLQQKQNQKKSMNPDHSIKEQTNQQEDNTTITNSNTNSNDPISDNDQDAAKQESDHDSDDSDNDDDNEQESDNELEDDDEQESETEQDDDEESENEQEDESTPKSSTPPFQAPTHDEGVSQQQTLFLRNLPFDTTRHDVFQLMHTFGHIDSIFLVKDKETGVFKGTAFLQYKTVQAAARAMEAVAAKSFTSQKEGITEDTSSSAIGLQLKGRQLYCDYAVDKTTASTLTLEHQEKATGKDRRNMYLKTEGRVANQADMPGNLDNSAWESLPESDQLKRQRAFMEKNTKLRSPLFFINPKRLSIRNLAKHVDETAVKKLVVEATLKGLSKSLVQSDDQVAHWRASGDMTTREILKRMETSTESIIPELNAKNIKESVPSVFIDRDFTNKKSEPGQSRGFGFVDFTHHVHALACLRELNNNPKYSVDFVAGGKKGNAKLKEQASGETGRKAPRLIVDFTVENKAKAKKQAEHRSQQQANQVQQRTEHKVKKAENKMEKKKSRGSLQREKKRATREEGAIVTPVAKQVVTKALAPVAKVVPQGKGVKPTKKRKLDAEEQTFERLVQSYTESFTKKVQKTDSDEALAKPKKSEKRWYE